MSVIVTAVSNIAMSVAPGCTLWLGHFERLLFCCACRCSGCGRVLKYGARRYGQRGGSNVPRGIMNMAMLGMTIRLVASSPSQEERSWWWWKVLQTAVKSALWGAFPCRPVPWLMGPKWRHEFQSVSTPRGTSFKSCYWSLKKHYFQPSAGPPAWVQGHPVCSSCDIS
jgi:hypothetical protein